MPFRYYNFIYLSIFPIGMMEFIMLMNKKNKNINFSTRFFTYFLIFSILSSCMPSTNPRSGVFSDNSKQTDDNSNSGGSSGNSGSGNNATTDDDDTDTEEVTSSIIELTQIVDPNSQTSTFRKKISIAKDYEGELYLSGLNISSLNNYVISVRFNLGKDKSSITVPAVIGRVPGGLQNGTNIDVIILDLKSKPFKNIRLLYDLFDYNDYQEAGTATDPVTDPTNSGLYCRGLKLEDDPTFSYSQTNTACDEAGETCLYAYAKIADSTLASVQTQDGTSVLVRDVPIYEQFDVLGSGYTNDTNELLLQKCLPESGLQADVNQVLGQSVTPWGIGGITTFDSTSYFYMGPYQTYGTESNWEISSAALFSPITTTTDVPTGIFQYSYQGTAATGYKSFMFPRAGKISYSQSGVQYYGSTNPFDSRSLLTLASAGSTKWMDGCNLRAKNLDSYSGETISSCNVTASIEIITTDTDGNEQILATSKDVKIQLLKAGSGVTQGLQYSAMKTCESNRACGTGECCFNSRCFSNDIVAQCIDDLLSTGNQGTGQSCASDFECSSLCCKNGVCADHNPDSDIFCSKVPSQACVSKEFCRQDYVRECYIIKTTDANGSASCEKRCYSVQKFGECINGSCVAPTTSSDPTFDESDPDRCEDAYDSPPISID